MAIYDRIPWEPINFFVPTQKQIKLSKSHLGRALLGQELTEKTNKYLSSQAFTIKMLEEGQKRMQKNIIKDYLGVRIRE